MEPNDLRRAMDQAQDNRKAMAVLTDRADAIMDIYKNAIQNFMAEPTAYDKDFNVGVLAQRAGWQQEKYYKGVAESLLVCATQAVLAAEAFHVSQRIKAAKKAGHKEGVKIEGVTMPDFGQAGPDLNAVCQCGHEYGYHTLEDKGFCLDMNCDCKVFKPAQGEPKV